MFTLDQKKAHDPRRHVSITANAGSGKTRVLVSRYCDLVELYGVRPELVHVQGSGARTGSHYAVRVIDGGETLARQTGLLDQRRRPVRGLPNKLTTGSRGDLAAIGRGAFLAAGTLSALAALRHRSSRLTFAISALKSSLPVNLPHRTFSVRNHSSWLWNGYDASSRQNFMMCGDFSTTRPVP